MPPLFLFFFCRNILVCNSSPCSTVSWGFVSIAASNSAASFSSSAKLRGSGVFTNVL
ncbi:hypothetical protein ECANGB1_2745 [Enterospora canceri]|uniref:Secreted protein n=1 Tax=Enterospora canceri TaxID=1081671 RepID=A0A1Y1S3V9_9MICR|nr:hypothetical protein ECANGB1_2745 [Enterospora canceri]